MSEQTSASAPTEGKGGRWSKVASIFIGICFLVIAAARVFSLFHPALANCSEDRTTDALRGIINGHTQLSLTRLGDQAEQPGATEDHRGCTATFYFSDGTSEKGAYTIDRDGRQSLVRVTGTAQ